MCRSYGTSSESQTTLKKYVPQQVLPDPIQIRRAIALKLQSIVKPLETANSQLSERLKQVTNVLEKERKLAETVKTSESKNNEKVVTKLTDEQISLQKSLQVTCRFTLNFFK